MDEKTISVIVPVYNAEQHLSQTIRSIINQTYSSFELILINDGSTDDSSAVIKDWAKKDNRIVYLHHENKGPSATRNKGLLSATGDYILFVDADDDLAPQAFEHMLEEISDSDLLIFGYQNHYQNNQKKDAQIIPELNGIYDTETFISFFGQMFNKNLIHYVWNKLYKRSMLSGCSFDENVKVGEDLLFNLEVMNLVSRVSISRKSYYTHNWYESGSITTAFHRNLFDYRTKQFEAIRQFLMNQNAYTEANRRIVEEHFFRKYLACMISMESADSDLTFAEKVQMIRLITYQSKAHGILSYSDKAQWEKIVVLLMKHQLTFPLFVANKGLKVLQNKNRNTKKRY